MSNEEPLQPKGAAAASTEDDRVGYGRPPKHTRFKPGQSGNRKGRPKGAKGFKQAAAAMLNERIQTRTKDGLKTTIRTREAIYLALREHGFKGNLRALEKMIDLDRMIEEADEAKAAKQGPTDIGGDDAAILARYLPTALTSPPGPVFSPREQPDQATPLPIVESDEGSKP